MATRIHVERACAYTPPPSPRAEPRARKPDAAPSHLSRLDALPVNLLVDQVFSWLAPPADIPNDLFSRGLDPWEFNWKLFPIQRVCRAWHWHAKTLASRYASHIWRLHEVDIAYDLVKPTSPKPPTDTITQLQIILGCPNREITRGVHVSAMFYLKSLHGDLFQCIPPSYWVDVFRECPDLIRLDLSAVPLRSSLLAAILDAASTFCRTVQALVLPMYTTEMRPTWGEESSHVLDVLARFLPRWKRSNGGLLELSLPWYELGSASKQRRLLDIVKRNCPHMRLFRGWVYHFHLDDDPRDHYGAVSFYDGNFETWRTACNTMASLEELYWHIPSEAQRFIKLFAATTKPQLKSMYLDYVSCPRHQFHFPGLDVTTVLSMFKATPNLEHFSLVALRYYGLQLDIETPHDRIVSAIVKHCPKLQTVRIQIDVTREDRPRIPMVSDAGVQEIVRLNGLQRVCLVPVRLTTTGLAILMDACMRCQSHDVEITIAPLEHAIELLEAALQHLIGWEEKMGEARPRFVLNFYTKFKESSLPTESTLPALASSLHDKWRARGHDVVVPLEPFNRTVFSIRWNCPKEPFVPQRRAVPRRSHVVRWSALRPFVRRLEPLEPEEEE